MLIAHKQLFILSLVIALLIPFGASAAALAELQAQLVALQQQVAALISQQNAPAAPSGAAASCPNLSRNLSHGMRGEDVRQLQQFLISQNLLPADSATGFFGALTEAAVKQWQSRNGIASSGSPATTGYGAVGPKTRAKIAQVCGGTSSLVSTNPPPSGTKMAVKLPTSPTELDAGDPAPPTDQALAEIVVLSQTNIGWQVRVDKIRDYIRYPLATNSQLNIGDAVDIRFNGWLDTFESRGGVCPAGYIKSLKPAQAGSTTQPPSTRPQPQITVGQKYLSQLSRCFAQANCQTIGWSGWLYNPSPTVIEYECVKSDTTTPPSTNAVASSNVSGINFTATPQSGTAPLTVNFRGGGGDGAIYTVDFGDGTSGIMQYYMTLPCGELLGSPPCGGTGPHYNMTTGHIYTATGIYLATLTTDGKIRGTITVTVTPPPPPLCAFAGSTVAHGASVIAHQSATVAYGQTCTSQTRTCTNGSLSGTYAYASCVVGSAQACSFTNQSVAHGSSVTAYQSSSVAYGNQCVSQTRICTNGSLSDTYQYLSCSVTGAQSCTFNNQTVAHGASVTAYQSSSVAYGSQCVSEQRTCINGSLSGSYAYVSCTVSAGTASCTLDGVTKLHGEYRTFHTAQSVVSPNTCSSIAESRRCSNGTFEGNANHRYASCSVTNPQVQTYQTQLLAGDLSGTSPFGPSIVMPNFYSPELLNWQGGLRMYFGGWYEVGARDGHDDIYVADCTVSGSSCSNVRMIIDGANQGPPAMNLNDPSIVTIQGANPYMVMYLTCTYHGEGAGSDKVCYTTSWANDGIVWGKPGTLMAGYALPSAVMKDSQVLLYALKMGENAMYRFNLGTSGTNVAEPTRLRFTNMPAALGGNVYHVNVHVRWDAAANKFYMLAQGPNTNVAWPWPAAIDLLESSDGIEWRLVHHAFMKPVAGQFELNAPAFHPNTIQTIFFGSTAATNSTGYRIRFGTWSLQ